MAACNFLSSCIFWKVPVWSMASVHPTILILNKIQRKYVHLRHSAKQKDMSVAYSYWHLYHPHANVEHLHLLMLVWCFLTFVVAILGGPAQNLGCSKGLSTWLDSASFCCWWMFWMFVPMFGLGAMEHTKSLAQLCLEASLSRLVWNKSYRKPSRFSAQKRLTSMRTLVWSRAGLCLITLRPHFDVGPCWTIHGHRISCLNSLEPLHKIVQGTHQHILLFTISYQILLTQQSTSAFLAECQDLAHWGMTVSRPSIPEALHKSLRTWVKISLSWSAERWFQQLLVAESLWKNSDRHE